MDTWLIFLAAMALTVALTPIAIRIAGPLGLLDLPAPRKVHSAPVPRVGGLAMLVGIVVPLVIWVAPGPFVTSYLAAASVLAVAGFWDDRSDLDYRIKFIAQFIAVLIVVIGGDVMVSSLTPGIRFDLPVWLAWPLTIGFIVGVTNAINLADGLDGLAGGTTLLCAAALCVLAFLTGDFESFAIGLALCGAILGFLRFNTHPARVFMGDCGSQLLGFTVAVLAVRITQNPGSAFSTAVPVLLLGLPIIDTLSVMVQRLAEGRSPFSADRNHIHHRLLALGLDHHQSVVIIYAVQGAMFLLAWLMRFEPDWLIVTVFLGVASVVVALLQAGRARGWRLDRMGEPVGGSVVHRWILWLRAPQRLPRWSRLVIAGAVVVYSLSVVVAGPEVSGDLAALALVLVVAMAVGLRRREGSPATWIERAVLYVAAAVLVYLDQLNASGPIWGGLSQGALFAVLVLAVGVNWYLNAARRFDVTPLDWLVIFLALALPALASDQLGPREAATGAAKLVALFYAMETLLDSPGPRLKLQAGTVVVLVAVALRGLLPLVIPVS